MNRNISKFWILLVLPFSWYYKIYIIKNRGNSLLYENAFKRKRYIEQNENRKESKTWKYTFYDNIVIVKKNIFHIFCCMQSVTLPTKPLLSITLRCHFSRCFLYRDAVHLPPQTRETQTYIYNMLVRLPFYKHSNELGLQVTSIIALLYSSNSSAKTLPPLPYSIIYGTICILKFSERLPHVLYRFAFLCLCAMSIERQRTLLVQHAYRVCGAHFLFLRLCWHTIGYK